MWRKATVYEPIRLGQSSARGLAERAQEATAAATGMLVATNKTRRRVRDASNALRAAQAKEVAT
jgi:hypothetical protein